jgi:YHS domain-containing protein
MQHFITILLITLSSTFLAQEYNLEKGFVAEGYDVVGYFNNKVEKGDIKFITTYDRVKFKFATKENLETFEKAPKKYIPAYGGYCAYALGAKGKKVSIDPETFEIRDGKLYLFYNSWGTNTLKLWKKEDPEKLKEKADKHWKNINN